MVKINEISTYKGQNYKRLSIARIKSLLSGNALFNKAQDKKEIDFFALPCKANIKSPWIEFFNTQVVDFKEFENFMNGCSYYNCNNEMGNYLHYYIKVK